MKMSTEWLRQNAERETKLGWEDGPRWRLKSELRKQEQINNLKGKVA